MEKVLLFRVDGGKVWGISMGHIKRSLLLANVLLDNYKVVFAMKNYQDGIDFVKKSGLEVEVIDADDDSDSSLINISEKHNPTKIIFDLYATPYTYFFEYARIRKIQTIVFDIIGKCAGVPDILINDSFVKEFTSYPHLISKTKIYLGPDYFLMDKPSEVVPINDVVNNVMITMGGSDPAGLTLKMLQGLLRNTLNYTLHVVLGPAFIGHREIYALVASNNSIKIYEDPVDFLKLLSCQDVVICAAGRTLYECAYFGRPVIVVPSIEHEAVISAEYARLTGSFNIGLWDESLSPIKLIKGLNKYNEDYSIRKAVYESSRALVDGHAMERIKALLEA